MQAFNSISVIETAWAHLLGLVVTFSCVVSTSPCTLKPPCTSCDYSSVITHPEDCRRYIYCSNGSPGLISMCPDGQMFSSQTATCVPQDATTKCDTRSNNQVQANSYNSGLFGNNQNLFLSMGSFNYPSYFKPSYSSTTNSGSYQYDFMPTGDSRYGSVRDDGYRNGFQSTNAGNQYRQPSNEVYPWQILNGANFLGGQQGYYTMPVSANYPTSSVDSFFPHSSPNNAEITAATSIGLSDNCGIKLTNRVVGGQEAQSGEWAWQVSLQKYDFTLQRWAHFCGAALVHESWLITAAHCAHGLSSPSEFMAVLGSYDLRSADPGQQTISVSSTITHPGYIHGGNYPNDIALVKLTSPARLSRSVNKVCLPEQETIGSVPRAQEQRCWVTGWGRTLGRTDANVLNEAEVDLVSLDVCAQNWADYITSSHMCASGRAGAGACEGDSGGPLSCSFNGRFLLQGVVSWGEDSCLLSGYPSVFTRVALYTDWISSTIGNTSF